MDYKFDAKNLEVLGVYNEKYPHAPQLTKYNTPISLKENYLRMFKGEKPLWMAAHTDNLYLGPKCVPDINARGIAGSLNAEPVDRDTIGGKDMFGAEWVFVPAVSGYMPKPGVVLCPDIENWEDYITIPDVDSWDWAGDAERNKDFISQGLATSFTIHNGLFERLGAVCEMQNALLALIGALLIAAVCLLPLPRKIQRTCEALEWRCGDNEYSVKRTVTIDGVYYDYLFKDDQFKGKFIVEGYPFTSQASAYGYFIANHYGSMWHLDAHNLPDKSLGSLLMRPNGKEFCVLIHEDGGWNGDDGLMLTGPATSREEAVKLTNKLSRKYSRDWLGVRAFE